MKEKEVVIIRPQQIIISKIDTGYLLTHYEDASDDSGLLFKKQFAINDDEPCEELKTLFYEILEYFGENNFDIYVKERK